MTHTQIILFGVTLGSAAALVVVSLFLGFRGRAPRDGEIVPTRDEMKRLTLCRLFYLNPADPRGWVPKPYGWGTTVNMRSRAWVGVVTLLFLVTIGAAIAMLFVRH